MPIGIVKTPSKGRDLRLERSCTACLWKRCLEPFGERGSLRIGHPGRARLEDLLAAGQRRL